MERMQIIIISPLSFIIKSRIKWGEIPWVYFYFLSSFPLLLLFSLLPPPGLGHGIWKEETEKEVKNKKVRTAVGFFSSVLLEF